MDPEKIHLPGLSDDDDRLLNHLLDKLAKCQPRNTLRASYYDGKRAVRQITTVLPPQYYRLGVVLGWSAKAVDILARRCNLEDFVWADGDIDDLGLREVVDANQFYAEINAGLVSDLIHSVAFLINTEGDDDEPASLIHIKDALNATGDWNLRTRSMDNLLSVTDRDDEANATGLALYLDGETITATKDNGKWSVDRTEHGWGVPVEALVYKPRIGRPFGTSRISRAVMSLHDSALRTVLRMEGHADVHSFPEYWMLGADTSIFKNPDGSVKPSWQVMLGRLKGVPDDDEAPESLARVDVKQFQASSPQAHLDDAQAAGPTLLRRDRHPADLPRRQRHVQPDLGRQLHRQPRRLDRRGRRCHRRLVKPVAPLHDSSASHPERAGRGSRRVGDHRHQVAQPGVPEPCRAGRRRAEAARRRARAGGHRGRLRAAGPDRSADPARDERQPSHRRALGDGDPGSARRRQSATRDNR